MGTPTDYRATYAILGALLAMGSTAWLRGFGYVSFTVASQIAAAVSFFVAVGLVATIAHAMPVGEFRNRIGQLLQILVKLIVVGGVLAVSLSFSFGAIGKIGAYGVPHLPRFLGLVLALGAIALAVAGCRKESGSIAVGCLTAVLAGYVVVTAYVWDLPGTSPHAVVRNFAAAGYRKDQAELNKYVTKESLANMSDYPVTVNSTSELETGEGLVTVSPFFGVGAKNAVIESIDVKGDTAEVRCPVPSSAATWGVWQMKGKMFTIYLLREDGEWKVDVARKKREDRERRARLFGDSLEGP